MKAVYIRTSTKEQTPELQLRDIKTIVNEPFKTFKDKQSAFLDHKQRPDFDLLKDEIKKGNVSELYVWDWDRLFRNRKKFLEFFKFCDLYKCKIHSFRQLYFEDFYKIPAPFDEIVTNLVLNLLGHNAEEESRKKGERVKLAVIKKEGKKTKSHNGKVWGRKSMNEKVKKDIVELRNQKPSMSLQEIADSISYYDKNRNPRFVSKSFVHKTLKKND